MKTRKKWLLRISFLILIQIVSFAQEKDTEGSQDHPLLTRMENFYISGFNLYDYESHEFYDAQDNEYVIEGKKWVIEYTLKEGFRAPGQLKVRENYIDSVKGMGGTVLFEEGLYMKVARETKEFWIDIWVDSDGSDYRVTVVERGLPADEAEPLVPLRQDREGKEDPELQRVKNAMAEIKKNRAEALIALEEVEQDIDICLMITCPGGVAPPPAIPIPYPKMPTISKDRDSKSVAADRAEEIAKRSEITKSEGDELGTTVKRLKDRIQTRYNRGNLSEKDKTAFTGELTTHLQTAKQLAETFDKYVEEVEKLLELWIDPELN